MSENPFSNFDWSWKSIGKIVGIGVIGLVGLSLVVTLVGFAFRTVVGSFDGSYKEEAFYGRGGGYDMAVDAEFSLAKSNMMPPEVPGSQAVDESAEDFEVVNYSVSYEKRDKTETCEKVFALKADPEIIFESSDEGERNCNYSFKVPKERTAEIVDLLNSLDPENLNENVHTIQKVVVGMTDEIEIQKKKLEQVEATLADAQASYDELTKLATQKNDIESLTKLIDLKLNTIDRLTREQLQINETITRIEKNRAEQLERLKYAEFYVSVWEDKIIDFDQIAASWKQSVRELADTINESFQYLTTGLIGFVFQLAVGVIYLAIAFVVFKVVWFIGRRVWKWKK